MKGLYVLLGYLSILVIGCEEGPPIAGGANGDGEGSDSDGDGIPDGSAVGNPEPGATDACDTLIEMTVRDFNESHPDFERAHMGWGPLQGVLESTLGSDGKPVFSKIDGEHQISQDETQREAYTFTVNNWTDTENPMFDGADSFHDWYRDSDRNHRYEKTLQLDPLEGVSGTYYFDSLEEPYGNFFALTPSEGFGAGPIDPAINPHEQNFLFTTEIHLRFEYVEGQVFKFSGDDDLWIFVNDILALDLGGLHSRFNGSIDFDAQAEALGITPGETYDMDIFHAERHTLESNFRIETNISCFSPGIVI
jgi:fibro-slime domain-containing protein